MLKPEDIFSNKTADEFNACAISIFKHQAKNCQVYADYIHHLKIDITKIEHITQIPFLPISFFKTHRILSNQDSVEVTFSSSGTTGMVQSSHHVTDVKLYKVILKLSMGFMEMFLSFAFWHYSHPINKDQVHH